MLLTFLSARLRRWVLLVVVLPLFGRLLQALGMRVSTRNPQVGRALSSTGSHLRGPRADPRRLGRRRRR